MENGREWRMICLLYFYDQVLSGKFEKFERIGRDAGVVNVSKRIGLNVNVKKKVRWWVRRINSVK